jgi:lipid A 3-O-deacylase
MTHGTLAWRAIGIVATVAFIALSGHRAAAQSGPAQLGPISILGDGPSYLELGAGAFNMQAHREAGTSGVGSAEFHYGNKLFFIGPAIGLLANTKGGVYGYGGFYSDIAWGNVVLTPFAGLGGYHQGGSIDLGNTFEFRLSAQISYQFDDKSRLGLKFAHISNSGISNRNPGENELLATYSIPLDLPF